ncbi:hypothetical protein HORIV_15480 [Vreelandella olivaria]|uniref:Uncharacterized protein n=1 Tax=Vreelandella olivaria TaxID=390919 RepID=A0ABN5WXA9_9GAMM|nr:hypothetical protein HORIV_15480 [Halomonas olivaria]
MAKRLGFAEAFNYAHPWEIFDEHARLSGFENLSGLENSAATGSPTRLFDISGLVGLGRDGYDALAPIQWPVTKAAPMARHGCLRMANLPLRMVAPSCWRFIPKGLNRR